MGKFTPTSQNFDGGLTPRRAKRAQAGPPPVVMVPVKRIGRDTERCYCPRCGQKRRVCCCGKSSNDAIRHGQHH